MKVLLDTNAYSALRRGHEAVAEQVRNSEEVLLSSIVVGELLFGFQNGSRFEANAQALRSFLEDPNVRLLPVTWDTADLFGRLSAALRKKGRPIPTNASGSRRTRWRQARISSPPIHTSAISMAFRGWPFPLFEPRPLRKQLIGIALPIGSSTHLRSLLLLRRAGA